MGVQGRDKKGGVKSKNHLTKTLEGPDLIRQLCVVASITGLAMWSDVDPHDLGDIDGKGCVYKAKKRE